MWARLFNLPWELERPTIPRRVFWQVCAGLPLTALVWWREYGFGGVAMVGLFVPSLLVVAAYVRVCFRRTERLVLLARDTARAAVYSTVILLLFASTAPLYWIAGQSHRDPLFRVDAATVRASAARKPGPLACKVKRNRRGRLFAEVRLTDYMSGELLMAKTKHGKIYAVWRSNTPPNYVATMYPIKIIVNSPKSLPVLLWVDFGPAGFTGSNVELNGKLTTFQNQPLSQYVYMWLPGGRNVIYYTIS